ncbi:heme ABC exporter ATP-binding protein CcmA [Coralloluteibacterium stylophorae]|uniref:Heme ABC exporter ATP-binding protein CcmA n=1 Tax=Coralloluteibacterium stylophorae TaxID=1776034 RepID=A0A8J7VTL5_9GAMM|nr:heme ABC exporter ATP-binding protein CcmA [Coralloluteibacterium stylophorae]MBS7457551.1 heme ABC exporter ATP-binding protein CcmA [Coralloluteibacterium stylophorae]
MSATPPLLSAHGLCFARNDEPVFEDVGFAVEAGEALLVLGGNGAGKTTLLRVLAGLLEASAGEVAFAGRRVDREHLARGIAYLGHQHGHKDDLGALENLAFAAGLMGAADADLEAALAAVGLAGHEDTAARRLSAGQKKRLALARLTLSPARLWLLDEPYANLDLDGIALVNDLVARHLADAGAVLLTTHGAYAAPPVRTRTLVLEAPLEPADA